MKKTAKKIFSILTPGEKKRLKALIVLNLFISILDIASLAMLLLIIDFYTQHNYASRLSFLPGWVLDNTSVKLIALFSFSFFLKNLAAFYIQKAQYHFVYNVASRLSETNLLRYFEGSYSDYVKVDSSVYIRKISQQPVEFAHYVLTGFQQVITEIILIGLSILAILLFNARLFLLLLVVLLPAVILLSFYLKKRTKKARASIKIASELSIQHLQEALNGFVEGNIYNKKHFFTSRYEAYQRRLNGYMADLQITHALPSRLVEVFAIAGLFIFITIHLAVSPNALGVVTIGAFIAAAYKIIPGIVRITNINGQIKTYEFTLTDLSNEKKDVEKMNEGKGGNINSMAFKNISFCYEKRHLLKNLNLCLEAGAFLGISGLSGKGKSTFLNLLLGFLEPSDGDITINHILANAVERQARWNRIGYVKQQPFLIYDTILKNITLDESNYDHKKLTEIIVVTGLNELLNKNNEGLNHIITENGKNISGGQRQRIAIARALYKETDMILLDEPFNELDQGSETAMLEHFKHLSQKGKMIILITHKKDSLSFCNKIISLDGQA